MKPIKILKKRKSALYASLFAVVLVGTPHIVPVVAEFSQFKSMWLSIPHAIAYAIALEAGIVFFALRSKMLQTIVFAIIATILYLGYYDADIPWWYITPFMPINISISLPIMLVLIAHETRKKRKQRKQQARQQSNGVAKPKKTKPLDAKIKQRIIDLLKEGIATHEEIAQQTGVNRTTVWRIQKDLKATFATNETKS